MPRIGPYHYQEGMLFTKEFGERRFSIIVSDAYEQGIVAPEMNGVVILDEDKKSVVLDRHLTASGFPSSPNSEQLRAARDIMEMDWDTFRQFCMSHPNFRGSQLESFNRTTPEKFPGEQDRIIFPLNARPEEMKNLNAPLESREKIIAHLLSHPFHKASRYSDWRFAWYIKVGNYDDTGMSNVGEGPGNPEFDEKWEEWLRENPEFFYDECAEAVGYFTKGDYAAYSRLGRGGWEFETEGRSSGWLVLTNTDFGKPSFTNQRDAEIWMRGLEDKDLVSLYVMMSDVDTITSGVDEEMSTRYALKRRELERNWSEEMKANPSPAGV